MPAESLTTELARSAGFFGKLPSRGEFVTRRLGRDFVDPWDRWLQDAIVSSREQLGEDWLDLYLTAPIWRFALSGGICGGRPVIGVLMPSVDSVGRFFPLTIALSGTDWPAPAVLVQAAQPWFDAAEELALSALAEGGAFEAFETAVEQLAPPPVAADLGERAADTEDGTRSIGWRFSGGAGCYGLIADAALQARFPQYCVWWTNGSPQVEPSLLVSPGLPPIGGFSAFIDGRWPSHGWRDGHASLRDAGR